MRKPSLVLIVFTVLVAITSAGVAQTGDPQAGEAQTDVAQTGSEPSLIGTWSFSTFISAEQFRASAAETAPEGVDFELAMVGTQTYQADGRYTADIDVTLTIKAGETELPLRFNSEDSGTWKLDGDTLTEVLESGSLTPLDEPTASFLETAPQLADGLRPVPGETTTSTLVSIDETTMETRHAESEATIVFTREP